MTTLINQNEIEHRAEEYLQEVTRRVEEGEDHECLWVTAILHRVADPSASMFEVDDANIVAWVAPHCAVCGRWANEVPPC